MHTCIFLHKGAGAYGASGGGDCAAKTRLAGHFQHHERLRPAWAPPAVACPLLLCVCVCMHACMYTYIICIHTHRHTHRSRLRRLATSSLWPHLEAAIVTMPPVPRKQSRGVQQAVATILNAFAEMGNMSMQCMHKHAHTHTDRRTHIHKHIHIHTYIHTTIQTYKHTHIHTFTHTYKHSYMHT